MAVRLRDVAAHAGVSARTVSNVINDHRYVSVDTRQKVQAAIEALDYRPNLLARSLRKGRTATVGLLLPDLVAPYFGELAHQVVEQAREVGLTVLVDETGGRPGQEQAQVDALSRSGHVDGILLSALGLTGQWLAGLRSSVPVVLLGERTALSRFDHVGVDNVAAAREVTEHLLSRGRTRIAAVAEGATDAATSQLRLQGYRAALAAAGLPYDEGLVAPVTRYSRAEGARAVGDLLERGVGLDAVFCLDDLMAVGALHELRRRGVRVPGQVCVAGFDDVEESGFAEPALTTLTPDKEGIARAALAALRDRIAGSTGPALDVRVGHRLTVRGST